MAGAKKGATILVKLASAAGTGFFYVKKKNPRTLPRKLEVGVREVREERGEPIEALSARPPGVGGDTHARAVNPMAAVTLCPAIRL